KILYVDLPAIQVAGFQGLQEYCSGVSLIQFMPPDEPEEGRTGYEINFDETVRKKCTGKHIIAATATLCF
ncbi:MAG: hypothetical protein KGL58_03160, partial [Pseudomonadota bacterium]|nr:hypothetical protein [Pseudomonadota bacterium]